MSDNEFVFIKGEQVDDDGLKLDLGLLNPGGPRPVPGYFGRKSLRSWWDVTLPPCPDCGGDVGCIGYGRWDVAQIPTARRCRGVPVGRDERGPVYGPGSGCGSVFRIEVECQSHDDPIHERVYLTRLKYQR